MKKLMEKIKNVLLYAGTDKGTFESIRPDVDASNLGSLKVFTVLVAVAMLAMVIASFFEPSLEKNRVTYMVCAVLSALMILLLGGPAKKKSVWIYVTMYLFCGMLFAFGIILGTFIDPDNVTVSYAIILFAVPLLMTDRPIRMSIAILLSIAVYIAAAAYTQPKLIFGYNMTNVIPYGIIAILVSIYMMYIKVERYVLAQQNRYLSESDQLTGLYNRRSFENRTAELNKSGSKEYTIYAFDLNGLKAANDDLGHQAGDELLIGAASCITEVFGDLGTCYRTGGDEFMAILNGDVPRPEILVKKMKEVCDKWQGKYTAGLSISVGAAPYEEGKSVAEAIAVADRAMYEAKAAYYKASGIDRRKR